MLMATANGQAAHANRVHASAGQFYLIIEKITYLGLQSLRFVVLGLQTLTL